RIIAAYICAGLLAGCTHLSPLRENSAANPHNSVVTGSGYKLAFIEFGEQGSYQDTTQLTNAVELVEKTDRPLVITYVHGWQNNAASCSGIRLADSSSSAPSRTPSTPRSTGTPAPSAVCPRT